MITAWFYLVATAVLGAALWSIGSRQWRSCVLIIAGLAIMTQFHGAAHPWLLALVIWAVVASGLTFRTGAPLAACAFAVLMALSYTIALLGGSASATVWTANGLGCAMLFCLLGGGIVERVGSGGLDRRGRPGRLAAAALRQRDLAPAPAATPRQGAAS